MRRLSSRPVRTVAGAAAALLAASTAVALGAAGAHAATTSAAATSPGCNLGHGVKHVIEITFDNVHFFRDNPNVPSDLELMPHLTQFRNHATAVS